MTLKDKLIFASLSIVTLGVYPLYVYRQKPVQQKTSLSTSEKLVVDSDELIDNLGGPSNVAGIEYTHTKVKLFINDKSKVKVDLVSKMKGVSGVYTTKKFVTIVVGNSAKALSEKLGKLI